MDWFERLTGFRESDYEDTRRRLEVVGNRLRSRVNGQSYGIGELELVSLDTLRERACAGRGLPGRLRVSVVRSDVRSLHRSPEFSGALFQVASQFNLLEMVGPSVTPEQGVARYEADRTQGPACAIAAGAATIYRNYLAPLGGDFGQTSERQLDGLADLGAALVEGLGLSVEALWTMRNGYAQCTCAGLDAISAYLALRKPEEIDALRGKLRIGVHPLKATAVISARPRPRSSAIGHTRCARQNGCCHLTTKVAVHAKVTERTTQWVVGARIIPSCKADNTRCLSRAESDRLIQGPTSQAQGIAESDGSSHGWTGPSSSTRLIC